MTNITQDSVRALFAKHHELLDRGWAEVEIRHSPVARMWFAVLRNMTINAVESGNSPDEAASKCLTAFQDQVDIDLDANVENAL